MNCTCYAHDCAWATWSCVGNGLTLRHSEEIVIIINTITIIIVYNLAYSAVTHEIFFSMLSDRLVGLVVRRLPRERKVPGSNPAYARIFSGSSHTCDLNIGIPVATLPGAWRYRVSAGTGRPGVSILWLAEMESLICDFYLSVAAHKIVQIRPWDTLACCCDVKQPTNKTNLCWTQYCTIFGHIPGCGDRACHLHLDVN